MNPKWQSFLTSRNLQSLSDRGPDITASKGCVIALRQFSCLAVTGEDAVSFLQGQSTCDVRALHDNNAISGAICNAKGRVLSTFWMFMRDNGYWLVLPESLIQSIEKRLRMYVLRSRVIIENRAQSSAIFGLCCERLAERLACAQADSHGQGYSVVITREDSQIIQVAPNQWLYMGTPQSAAQQWTDFVNLDGFAETNEEEWNQLSIRNGIPTLGPETTEVFVPQMINLDALGGISFEKGCYTGQEIVARMHYLGKLKRRMVLAATRSTQLPAPGEPVYASENEQSIGQIVNAAFVNEPEILLLAVIQTEWIESESLHLFNPDASTLKILELPYVILQPAA